MEINGIAKIAPVLQGQFCNAIIWYQFL